MPIRLRARGATYLPEGDVHSRIRFNLTAYHQQAQAVRGRLDRSGGVWALLADFVEGALFGERVVSALHEVAMTGRVRRLRYEHAEALATQQAQRDLRDLAAAGVLEPVGRTRSRYYTARRSFPPGGARNRPYANSADLALPLTRRSAWFG